MGEHPPYERLTRPRGRCFGVLAYTRSSLWLGKDHLLEVDSSGYSESYKRFYFQDIQAVVLRLTQRRLIWNWVLGVPTALWLAGWGAAWLASRSLGLAEAVIVAGATLILIVPLVINNLRGPGCACQLRTAVQTEDIPSINRLRQARRILDRLRPLIAQAQGLVSTDEIPARLQAWMAATSGPGAAEGPPAAGLRYEVDDPNLPPRIAS